MFNTILVAFDGTTYSEAALRQSAEIARLSDARLHLVGVVADVGKVAITEPSGPYEVHAQEHGRLERTLAEAAQAISSSGLEVQTDIREGDPAEKIYEAAKALNADLLVVGHSDKGGLARWLAGSVSEDLVRDLPCSVLVAAGE